MKTFKPLLIAVLALLCSTAANAHDFEVNGIYYSILSTKDKTVTVTYRGTSCSDYSNEYTGSVVIPTTVKYNNVTYGVTSIRYDAFRGCSGLTSVTIPNSVTEIGYNAFSYCTGLASIVVENGNSVYDSRNNCNAIIKTATNELIAGCKNTVIPNSVTSIGNYAFEDCTGLESITIPNSVTSIWDYAFYGCTGLASIEIPNSVTSIGGCAFSGCTGLASITIPNSVTSIRSSAFYGCTGLESVTIGNSVTSIEGWAFYNCSGLTSIEIPNSVTSIGYRAFYGCSSLKTVINFSELTLSKGSSDYGYVAYYVDKVINILNSSIEGDYVFVKPNDVNTLVAYIGNDTELTLPADYNGENYIIGDYAFYNCTSLASIEIPNSVTSIGDYAFRGCSGLTGVTIPTSVTSIGNSAFYGCNIKKAIWLTNTPPSGYKNIDATVNYVANNQYSGLSNVKIYPYLSSLFDVNGVKYVPVSPAERTCDAIDCTYDSIATEIKIEKSVLFKGVAMNVKQVMPYTFYANKYIKTLNIDNDSIIGDYAFSGCTSLVTATISNNGNIGSNAFSGCICLNNATISNNGNIGEYAFNGCTNLNNATISNNGDIGGYAFRGCTNLVTATISNNGNIGEYAFNGCTNLVTATISNNGDIGDYAFRGCSSLVTAALGDGIASIGTSAFSNCVRLEEIVIHDAVTVIGSGAFYNCSSLGTAKIGNGTKSINSDAFAGCSSLASITLGDSVTTIGENAFSSCSSLSEIVIPQSVTKIGNYAFNSCTSLTDVIINDRTTALSLGSNGSSPLFSDCPLDSVYIGGKITYSTSSSYGYSPFYRNTSLRSVVITDTEEEVYNNEFYGCLNLKNVSIGNGVKRIGNWAFSGCSSLDYFAFGRSVQSIGEEAFSDCNNVTKLISRAKTPPTCGTQALDDINKWNCTLWVPENYKAEYQAAEQWKEFFFVEGIAAETYTVTFIVDGEIYETIKVEYYEEIPLPETPTKEGHTFSGWSEIPETMPAEDITIIASFTVNSYLLTYIVDGEVYATDSIAYGTTIEPLAEPTKVGHTFSGWSEIPETMPAEDITIIASFTVNSYLLTYIVDGEVYATDSIAYGTAIEPLAEPTKVGHTFSGWSEIPETMPAEDITITGSFTVNSYLLTYIVDGEVYATDSIAYGTAIEPLAEPTKVGHTFSGWSEIPETMPAEDCVIEGTFSINSYIVTFMIDGEVYETITVEYGAVIELPEVPEKEGYVFNGWVGVPETMPAEDIVIEGSFDVDTTGINAIDLDLEKNVVYDLNGLRITETENLTRGIYIINGKKVYIK